MLPHQPSTQVSLPKILLITAGPQHSLALSDEGIWSWGRSTGCNLGIDVHESIQEVETPQLLPFKAKDMSAGKSHSFVWSEDEVYCWGDNKECQLGFEGEGTTIYPFRKSEIFAEAMESGMKLEQITCGDSHSLALFKEEGENSQVYAWGESKNSQLALETEGAIVPEPIMIEFNHAIDSIYSRSDYNFIVTENGECYSWGNNLFGRLGFGNLNKSIKIPTKIKNIPMIESISMGKHHCLAITREKIGYSWGHGLHGQLGIDEIVSDATPQIIHGQFRILMASCGESHSLAVDEKGNLMSCGSDSYGGLGHTEIDNRKRCKKFVKVELEFAGKIKMISCGYRHNLLLTDNGKVYSWGCNKEGQLGRSAGNFKEQKVERQLYQSNESVEVIKKPVEEKLLSEEKCLRESSICKIEENESLMSSLADWKERYKKFKSEQERKEGEFMKELDDLMKNSKF